MKLECILELLELVFNTWLVWAFQGFIYMDVISFENVVLVFDNTPEKFPTEKRNPNILILQQKLLLA